MPSRDNNFDLIRLAAAMQVLVMHALVWLEVPAPSWFLEVADWFPGVPIFFAISGWLVTASYARSPTVGEYLRNRALRILPGLWVCLLLSYAAVVLRGGLGADHLLLRTLAWFAANGSMFQFAGAFGTGVANGALWSIATEIQFYLLIPLVGQFAPRAWRRRATASLIIVASIALSSTFHAWTLAHESTLHPWVYPVLYASVLANGFFFLFGVLAYLWVDRLTRLVQGRALAFVGLYLAASGAIAALGHDAAAVHASVWSAAVYPLLALAVFSAAHSAPGLSRSLLQGHDLSYGLYIYHMPVIYALLHHGLAGGAGLAVALVLVAAIAAMSWLLVERPMLRRKHYSALPAAAAA
jgi:peptidoglycan/LPS O-acetylase OafA/YrhL